nr:SLC13 family permease [Pyrolobus fumarii]
MACLVVLAGAVDPSKLPHYVNLDVLGLVYLMSIVTGYLEISGVAELVAARVSKLGGKQAVFWMLMASGGLSLLLENVSVVYLFAPVALKLAQRVGVDPVAVVVGVALSSDMAGSATMIGDPPAIITAGYLNLNFMDFIIYKGRPSMFFYTVAAMVAACMVVATLAARRATRAGGHSIKPNNEGNAVFAVDRVFLLEVTVFVIAKIVLLSIRDQIHIPLTLAALVAVGGITLTRILIHRDTRSVKEAISKHDIETPLFLAGVFVISGAFVETGLASQLANLLLSISGGDVRRLALLLIAVSVLASAVIYNTPYVAAMLPVVVELARNVGADPVMLAWALLIGATLGGTLTYIGAMGNYAAVRFLAARGYPVGFTKFASISVPFTLVSVLIGTILYIISWW